MQKLKTGILIFLCFIIASCSKQNEDAEIKYLDENQVETSYIVQKTENPEDVKKLFQILDSAKTEISFNGVALDLDADIAGKVKIEGTESRKIELDYTLNAAIESNLKKYLMNGSIVLNGLTKTDSDSLQFNTKYEIKADIQNDDEYLYLTGDLRTGTNYVSLKNKLDIGYVTENYKAMIISCIDLLKYYKITSLLPNINEMIDAYQIIISHTTKDSFTLKIHIPIKEVFPEIKIDECLTIETKISCFNLLPLEISFSADDLLAKILENDYVEQYLSSKVIVEESKLSILLKLEYGYYTIKELTEEQKAEYKEYLIKE